MEKISQRKPVHIALLPGAGVGHLNPMLEFIKRLIHLTPPNTFSVTVILIPAGSSSEDTTKLSQIQTSFLSSLPSGGGAEAVDFVSLPPPVFETGDFSTFPEEMAARVYISIKRSLPPLRDLLVNLCSGSEKGPLSSLIVDMFGTQACDLAIELGIDPYVCFQSSAMGLALLLHLPELDATMAGGCEFGDMPEPVKIPGCDVRVPGKDLPDAVLNRKALQYSWVLEHANKMQSPAVRGIILNSFDALESKAIAGLRDGRIKPTVYPVGPLTRSVGVTIREDDGAGDRHKKYSCLKWLDEQPPDSVLFINFGSGGTLTTRQLHEIATGLELSGQRFLWVVRIPNEEISFGSYLGGGMNDRNDPLSFLPEGFLDRTKARGLVVPNWAPQVPILCHESTGGFLTHCGWNSILEGIVGGVPFIAWPLFAEQNLNAVLLEEGLKVALRVRPGEMDGLVGHDQIAGLIKGLMSDQEMARRVKAMKEDAAKAVGECRSSSVTLGDLATELLKKNGPRCT